MAKRSKALPARKSARSRDDDSVLIRTAESLGRMIGSLQRQLQDATSHMADAGDAAYDALPELPQLDDVFGREKKKKKNATARTKSSRGAARKKAPQKSAKSRGTAAAKTTKRSRPGARGVAARRATAGGQRSRKASRKR
jgi:hypothetical protein